MKRMLAAAGIAAAVAAVAYAATSREASPPAAVDRPVTKAAPPIGADLARELLAQGALLVDVREPQELEAGKLQGAINVPLTALKTGPAPEALQAAKERPVILYCRSGRRSAEAGEILLREGFREVYNLGGFEDAVKAGLPAG